ncbi:MAG: cytochrome c oxidase subunit II [Gammaproteobacteria bacterium]|nr:cytochrome c oxidase subunit II [Gammaproteobacteria bacterium]
MDPAAHQSALHPAGPIADTLLGLTGWLTWGAVLIFLGVMALLAWAMRRRAAREPDEARDRSHARWLVLGGGVLFPVVVLGALFVYSIRNAPPWREIPPSDALVIGVTGHMWWWDVRYRDPASGREFSTANEIRIPTGRPIYLGLSSGDVIHSFWVPALGGKMDMLPGRMQHLLLQAATPGVYRGQCAEFCGEQHARMALHVVAMPPDEFDRWLAAQALPAPPPATAELVRGRDAFVANRCGACHTVRGVTEESRLGPDLTHLGGRLHLGAGQLPMSVQALTEWIGSVQRIKPGARMPSSEHRLDPQTLNSIALWLAHRP